MDGRDPEDAVVIGSGPNGLAAAITLAKAGWSISVLERETTIGGGARSGELTLPGFLHDVCSAIHPMAAASPFFRDLPLSKYGLTWIPPPIPLAHPFDDGTAACLHPSVEETAQGLGVDASAYRRWMSPFVKHWENLFEDLLRPIHFPRHPFLTMRFGWSGLCSAEGLADRLFLGEKARGLLAGLAAHSFLPLTTPASSSVAVALAVTAHAVGWPLPPSYRGKLQKFRLGPGVFKVDWALSGPIPWMAESCRSAGTVHLGATFAEIAESEKSAWEEKAAAKPFVILSQPSLFDPTRAPSGRHTAWAYCHVPRGSTEDMTERIEAQIERFAPGFKEIVLARKSMAPADLERHNPNYIGGDISGGVPDLRQILFRPTFSLHPYATPIRGWYLCSSSTPPGPGVHGLCGYHAARFALEKSKG